MKQSPRPAHLDSRLLRGNDSLGGPEQGHPSCDSLVSTSVFSIAADSVSMRAERQVDGTEIRPGTRPEFQR